MEFIAKAQEPLWDQTYVLHGFLALGALISGGHQPGRYSNHGRAGIYIIYHYGTHSDYSAGTDLDALADSGAGADVGVIANVHSAAEP